MVSTFTPNYGMKKHPTPCNTVNLKFFAFQSEHHRQSVDYTWWIFSACPNDDIAILDFYYSVDVV